MAYRIAVASSDGIHVDLSFGATKSFLIYEVDENNSFRLSETREYRVSTGPEANEIPEQGSCAGGNGGLGGGCGGQDGSTLKIALVEDCRCVLCSKLGFQIRKQLEKKAITVFDISYEIDAAIVKIVQYFDRLDHHQNLRGLP